MIIVDNLSQVYKSGRGIFDINFKIKDSEAFGYLGPNGAGKTTTIRSLMGFMNPTSGSSSINGFNSRTEGFKYKKDLGYLPGEITFFENMTGIAFLSFMAELMGNNNKKRRDDLIERFDLDTSVKIRRMSKGMKQKLGIVSAFMHDPSVYILDEPTSGLDPMMQNSFIDLILEEKGRGKTIMMSSHIFDEVQRTCDRAGIIKDGRIVAIEDVNSLRSIQNRTFIVTFNKPEEIALIEQNGISVSDVRNDKVYIQVQGDYNTFIAILSKYDIGGINIVEQTLESVFMKYYGQGVSK